MTRDSAEAALLLSLDRAGVDDERLDELVRSLRGAIEEAELDGVRSLPTDGSVPAGARGDAFTLGALALAVAPVLVEQIIGIVGDWSNRPNARPVKVSVRIGDREISGEYDAATMTASEIAAVAGELRRAIDG